MAAPAERPFLDVREDAAAREAPGTPAQEALRRSLGMHGVVDVDPLTGTPRVVARLDGFLTEVVARVVNGCPYSDASE